MGIQWGGQVVVMDPEPGPKGDPGPPGKDGAPGPAAAQYYGMTMTTAKMFIGGGTTTNGVATIYLTQNGTATGAAIFTKKPLIFPSAEYNASTATDAPAPSIKSLSADFKTLTLQASRGASVSLLGLTTLSTSQYVPNGTVINVFAIGE